MNSIHKVKKLTVSHRDLYLLTSTPGEIIVNSDSVDHHNEGLMVYDHDLKQKKEIIFTGEKVGIYRWFKKFSNDEILLYCPDAQCLVHVNLKNSKTSTLPLHAGLNDIVFSPVYWWEDSYIILSDYNNNFYRVSLEEKLVSLENKSDVKHKIPHFLNYYNQAIHANKIYSAQYQYIVKNSQNKNIELYNFKTNKKISVSDVCPDAHDYEYRNDLFICIGEQEIVLLESENTPIRIKPTESYRFLRASFLSDNTFIVLSCCNDENELTIYGIEKNILVNDENCK